MVVVVVVVVLRYDAMKMVLRGPAVEVKELEHAAREEVVAVLL